MPTDGYLQIMSIDPALKNLAVRIERRYFASGKTEPLVYFRVDLKTDTPHTTIYTKVTDCLRAHLQHILTCHLVLMERQLPTNYMAVRISQHILTFLLLTLESSPLSPRIIEVESKLKYKSAPKELNNQALKKSWGPQKAREILTQRSDKQSLEIFEKERKKDDLADVVLQIEVVLEALEMVIPVRSGVKFVLLE